MHTANLGNLEHDVLQGYAARILKMDSLGKGTSWQDVTLAMSGMDIGSSLAHGMSPAYVGDAMRYFLGPEGPGSYGFTQALYRVGGPLGESR